MRNDYYSIETLNSFFLELIARDVQNVGFQQI